MTPWQGPAGSEPPPAATLSWQKQSPYRDPGPEVTALAWSPVTALTLSSPPPQPLTHLLAPSCHPGLPAGFQHRSAFPASRHWHLCSLGLVCSSPRVHMGPYPRLQQVLTQMLPSQWSLPHPLYLKLLSLLLSFLFFLCPNSSYIHHLTDHLIHAEQRALLSSSPSNALGLTSYESLTCPSKIFKIPWPHASPFPALSSFSLELVTITPQSLVFLLLAHCPSPP